jgi:TolA-binding protein
MRQVIFGVFTLIILSACANNVNDGTPLGAFKSNPTEETYQALINDLLPTLRNAEASKEERLEALKTGYEASIEVKKNGQAIGFLNTMVKEYFDSEETPERLLELAKLLETTKKTDVAETLAQGFLKSFPNHPKASEAQAMIRDNAPDIEKRINDLGQQMFDSQAGQLNIESARSFVDVCEAYAMSAPAENDVPDYLHKAAETARAMRTIPKALSLYDWILEQYPDHEKAPQALFLKAFTYDNNLNDTANARKNYTAFLEKFPEDEFADDTKFLLENLGKSDEEILESLTKKGQKN